MSIRLKYAKMFESAYDIGDAVWVHAGGHKLPGHIRVVLFTNGKVRYSVCLEEETTLHNIDSALISKRDGPSVTWDFDNYS